MLFRGFVSSKMDVFIAGNFQLSSINFQSSDIIHALSKYL